MKATILSGALIAATFLSVAAARGQGYAIRAPYVYYPGWYHHASTYEEGLLRGWGAVAQALGEYHYNTSLALIHREEARSRYLDNRSKSVQTYFTLKKINKEYRAQERTPRLTREDYARLAAELGPKRLSRSQYEPSLGKLHWPALLEGDEFSANRQPIDRLIAERTIENSGLGSANQRAITGLVAQMKSDLKKQVRAVDPTEYVQAKNFLESLDREVRSPIDIQAIAAN
jgi:hypothetical protein